MRTEALLTSMDAPLGRAVGNANEVDRVDRDAEGAGARGRGEPVRAVWRRGCSCCAGIATDDGDAERRVRTALASGAGAREVPRDHRGAGRRSRASSTTTAGCRGRASRAVGGAARPASSTRMDAELVGRAAVALGAGRDRADAASIRAVGIDIVAPVGTQVQARRSGAHDSLCGDADRLRRRAGAARSTRSRSATGAAGVAPLVIGTDRRAMTPGQSDADVRLARASFRGGSWRDCNRSVGLVLIALDRLRAVDQSARHPGADDRLGLRPAVPVRAHRAQDARRPAVVRGARRADSPAARLCGGRVVVRLRPDRQSAGVGADHDTRARARTARSTASIFAFQIAPTIIFIAALFAILYYFGIMQFVVRLFALVMNRVMGASGAESLNVAASIFMGQTEAPLTIRPYLPRMTAVRADDGDDVRHGAHLRRHHGGLHRVRHRAEAPAHGGDHDGAGHADDGQDVRAGDRGARDAGHREARRRRRPTST